MARAAVKRARQEEHEMLVQRTLFTGPHPRVEPGMYVAADRSRITADRTAVRLDRGASLSTNTYFGRFAASYWQRYTDVDEVTLDFAYTCDPDTRLLVDIRASDISGRQRPVQATELTGTGRARMDIPIRRFIDGGAVWFDLIAAGGCASVSDVTWTVADPPPRNRDIAVVMCTYNRPADAIATVLTATADPVLLDRIDAIYLVDQGTDRVESHPEFPRVKEVLGDRLHYLTQPNLGGAGGFNRGIHEITRPVDASASAASGVAGSAAAASGAAGSASAAGAASASTPADVDIVVMDDDILCEPESILRLSVFADYTVEPMLVGSQMLLLSETYRVHMTGEWEALAELKAGQVGAHGKSGFNALEHQQEVRTDAGWNGWWSCLLPPEAVAAAGMSLPLFFQWDDIEFGIRARKSGFPTVTLPNAGVWHADFHLKDYDDWSRYFSWRNALIVAAIHGPFDPKSLAAVVAREIGAHIVSMRYGLAATFLLAVNDFLSGPEVLRDGGRSKLAELAELRGRYRDTQIVPATEAGRDADPSLRISAPGPEPKRDKLTQVLIKRGVQQGMGRVSPAPVSMSAHDARWWHVGLFDSVIVSDASQTGVRVRKRDKQTALRLGRELLDAARRLRRDGADAAARWRTAMPELTSRANWKRLFDGD
ncbi:glycosyltransferase [Gordonia sinesedis]